MSREDKRANLFNIVKVIVESGGTARFFPLVFDDGSEYDVEVLLIRERVEGKETVFRPVTGKYDRDPMATLH